MTLEILVKSLWKNMKKLLESFLGFFDIGSYTILDTVAAFHAAASWAM